MKKVAILITSLFLASNVYAGSPVFNGEKLYKKHCKKCHGLEGEGKRNKKNPKKYKYKPVNVYTENELKDILIEYREMRGLPISYQEKKMVKAALRLRTSGEVAAVSEFIGKK